MYNPPLPLPLEGLVSSHLSLVFGGWEEYQQKEVSASREDYMLHLIK